jgi:hypothetical protein
MEEREREGDQRIGGRTIAVQTGTGTNGGLLMISDPIQLINVN